MLTVVNSVMNFVFHARRCNFLTREASEENNETFGFTVSR
jgi:hypothetical protein